MADNKTTTKQNTISHADAMAAAKKQIARAERDAKKLATSFISFEQKQNETKEARVWQTVEKLVPIFDGLSKTAQEAVRKAYKEACDPNKTNSPTGARHCAVALAILKGNLKLGDDLPSFNKTWPMFTAKGDVKAPRKENAITAGGKTAKPATGATGGAHPEATQAAPSAYIADAKESRAAHKAVAALARLEQAPSGAAWQQARRDMQALVASVSFPK